ncbi:MAG TPA: nuclear transport factor 2 family protein [Candidatus Acidoferrum sp.]|nr:nuclear transport factor 2 family protein [Candidatus Acidoferrum sp.]
MRAAILIFILGVTSAFWQTASPDSAGQIRSVRQEIDRAFQQHDAKRLAALVTSDGHFTAPEVHTDGADALEHSRASLFTKRPDVTLEHHTNRIAVNENWDLASEQGDWVERWTNQGVPTELRGTYLAMWKRDGGRWREYCETIVPETCTGSSYCQ